VDADSEEEAVRLAGKQGIFVERAVPLAEKSVGHSSNKATWIATAIAALAIAFAIGIWAVKKPSRSISDSAAAAPENPTTKPMAAESHRPNPPAKTQSTTDAERLAQPERDMAQANDLIRRQQEQLNAAQRAPVNDAQSPEALTRSFSSFADHFVKQAIIYQNGNAPSGRNLRYKLISAEVIKTDSLSHPVQGILVMEQILSNDTFLFEDKDTARFTPDGQGWKFVSGETLVENAPSDSEFSKPGQTKNLPDYWVAAVLAAKRLFA
jgi:hypothetical protein